MSGINRYLADALISLGGVADGESEELGDVKMTEGEDMNSSAISRGIDEM